MSMGIFVVDNTAQDVESSCKAILGYRDILGDAIKSGTGSTYEDADYPLSMALDQSYFTEYSVDIGEAATEAVIVFSLSSVEQINYFMLISKNAEESELSVTVEAFIPEDGGYAEVAGFGSMTNGVPKMVYFGDDFDNGYANATFIRVTLNYTSKPYIMSMMCGKAIVFPRTFSLGAQPASMSYLDDVSQFDADEGLNVINGRRVSKGKQLRGSINYVRMDLVREFWSEFANHVLDSKPVCMMWNDNLPNDVIYGIQNPDRLTKPTYKTSLFTQIDFDIAGWA